MRRSYNPYPWLDVDDPRREMTDEEILYQYINLSESHLTRKEKEEVMDLIVTYKKAFSLRDEIGKCPDIKVPIEVNDPSTFFVRPFPIAEEDKPLMECIPYKWTDHLHNPSSVKGRGNTETMTPN